MGLCWIPRAEPPPQVRREPARPPLCLRLCESSVLGDPRAHPELIREPLTLCHRVSLTRLGFASSRLTLDGHVLIWVESF